MGIGALNPYLDLEAITTMRSIRTTSWWLLLAVTGGAVLLVLFFGDYLWINLIHRGSVDSPRWRHRYAEAGQQPHGAATLPRMALFEEVPWPEGLASTTRATAARCWTPGLPAGDRG